jgi:hypothetical protein
MQIHRLVTRTPLFAATITIAAGLAAAPAAHAQTGSIVSEQNGKCLQPVNASSNAGDAIVQEPCDGNVDSPAHLAQQWTSIPAHRGISLVNGSSGLCLDARGGPTNGTPIQQWPCIKDKGISNEFWTFDGFFLSSGVNPNPWAYCITTPGDEDGLPMELQACERSESGNFAQRWNRVEG